MRKTFTKSALVVGAIVLVGLSLSGCGAADGDRSAPLPGSEISEDEGRITPPEQADEDGASDAGACLDGDWHLTPESLAAFYQEADQGAGIDGVTVEGGGMALSLYDGDQFIFSTDGDLVVAMYIDDYEATMAVTGGVGGTYTDLGGGIMSTQIEDNHLDVVTSVAGIEINSDDLGFDTANLGAFTGYGCGSGTLTIETQAAGGGTALMHFERVG